MFIADEATRTFTNNGQRVYSVSDVLALYFPFKTEFMTADAATKGQVRHEWYSAIIQNPGIELEDPDPRIAGEVAAFRKFVEECRPVYKFGEVRYFDPILGVCGKPDFVGEIAGRLSICDWKPEHSAKRTRAQTAAYKHMLNANSIPVLDRFELRLHADGKYRLDKHRDDGDLTRWPALVAGFFAATHYR